MSAAAEIQDLILIVLQWLGTGQERDAFFASIAPLLEGDWEEWDEYFADDE
jgi:hypothetical protein